MTGCPCLLCRSGGLTLDVGLPTGLPTVIPSLQALIDAGVDLGAVRLLDQPGVRERVVFI